MRGAGGGGVPAHAVRHPFPLRVLRCLIWHALGRKQAGARARSWRRWHISPRCTSSIPAARPQMPDMACPGAQAGRRACGGLAAVACQPTLYIVHPCCASSDA